MLEQQSDHRADLTGSPDNLADTSDADADHGEPADPMGPSLADDLFALYEDGKTYAQAEVAFQKSRASYTANKATGALVFGLGAFAFLHLALIALVVGAVIALVPVMGPWLATGLVTLLLLVGGAVLLFMLKSKIDDIRQAFTDKSNG